MARPDKDARFRGRRARHAPAVARPACDPVRLAAVKAYLNFARGGAFQAGPPPHLHEDGEKRRYVQLIRGMVRHRRLLEAEVARLALGPAQRLHAEMIALAVLGLYQLRFLDVPPHAAVYETVALAPALGRGHAKGWANAVLRAALREGLRGEQTATPAPLAVRTSHPDWMVERWIARYGPARTRAICEANNRYDGTVLRVETRRIRVQTLLRRLSDEGIAARPHPLLSGALSVDQLGGLLHTRVFRDGLCYVQDVSSQLLVAWAAPALAGRVLEACTAPGGKLTHLRGLTAPGRWLVGMDVSRARMGQVLENLRRLRLPATPLLVGDARSLPFPAAVSDKGWDAVLVDAPCSATGIIRKYPELKWRKHPSDLPQLVALQGALLAEAARVLRAGGHIVYATCSLEPEENEQAVAEFLARHPDFQRRPFSALRAPRGLAVAPDTLLTAEGDLLMLPGSGQMGLYAALLQKRLSGQRTT